MNTKLFFFFIIIASSLVKCEISCGISNQHPSNATECSPISESKVIGGECANPGQFPWVTLVQLQFSGRLIGFCGGAILDNYTVMTAGHCTYFCLPLPTPTPPGTPPPGMKVNEFNVSIGDRNIKDSNDGQQYFITSKSVIHPSYKPCSSNYSNDIALLKFDKPLSVPYFSDNGLGSTNTICSPAQTDYNGVEATIAGWGRVNKDTADTANLLQYASVQVISNEECKKTYGGSIKDTMICAFDPDRSSCSGDSGTALFVDQPDEANSPTHSVKAIGITSFGKRNCQGYPVVYTRVSKYADFINANLGPPK